MAHELESQRLRLRACTPADRDALHALWTDPEVRRFLWDDKVIGIDVVDAVIAGSEATFSAHGFGQWMVFEATTGTFAGFTGLRYIEDSPDIEILYGLYPAFWGKGIATEASRCVLQYGFQTLGLPRILGDFDTPNVQSERVIERLGMTREGELIRSNLPTVRYSLTREAFLRASAAEARA